MAETLRPFVYWGQKADSVSLKVDLRSVTVENMELTEDKLAVNLDGCGAQGHNKYSFDISFYLPVNPDESKVRSTERGVEFSIKKQGAEVWPRLTEHQGKIPWLKIDFDKFAFEDDSEEEKEGASDKQATEELIRKLEEDIRKNTGPPLNMKTSYLVLYNLAQFVGFSYIFTVLLYNWIQNGADAKLQSFEKVGYQIMFCQGLSVLEVLHPLLGLVKTGVLSPIMQVSGRNFILFMLILQDVRLQDAPVVWDLFLTWSAVELIRYPFYMLSSLGMEIKAISWLRYTTWIPLYPLGILFEATVVIMAIPLFEKSGIFSLQLPNASNLAFYFPWFLHLYLVILATGGVKMMLHMYRLRKKKLYPTSYSKKAQ